MGEMGGRAKAEKRTKGEIWENGGVRHMGETGGWAKAETRIKGEIWGKTWGATYGRNGWVGVKTKTHLGRRGLPLGVSFRRDL